MTRAFTFAGLGIGISGLGLQFFLTMLSRLASGDNLLGAFVFFISFFTILTNLALVLVYASALSTGRSLSWFQLPWVRAMMVGIMVLVMVFYHFLLADTWAPEGWFTVCDIVLHYVTPISYLIWWVWVQPHGGVRFGDIPAMFVPSIVYVIYILIRGAITDIYPYPVFEAHSLGYAQVAINIAALLLFTGGLFIAVVLADKRLGCRWAKMA